MNIFNLSAVLRITFFALSVLLTQSCDLEANLLLQSNSILPEASDVTKVGLYYYVVGDDTCDVAKVSQDGQASVIETSDCRKSDFEAVFRHPTDTDDDNPTLVICKEDARNCSPWKNGEFMNSWSLVDGGDGCHDSVRWNKNKGIEGAIGVQDAAGDIFMFALIEGTGSIITYRLDAEEETWFSQSCTEVPANFQDYSGISVYGSTIAVVSQDSEKLWVGEIIKFFDLQLSQGEVYDFPRKFDGVEGIFIEQYDMNSGSMSGVICSDDQGSGDFQNAVHRFNLLCSGTVPSTTNPTETTQVPSLGRYYMSSTGYCNEQSELIVDDASCEEAARVLGLSDTSLKTTQNKDRPYGCYYREVAQSNQLWLNINDKAEKELDDSSRRSLCKRISNDQSSSSTSIQTSVLLTLSPTTSTPSRAPSNAADSDSGESDDDDKEEPSTSTQRPSTNPSTTSTSTSQATSSPIIEDALDDSHINSLSLFLSIFLFLLKL